MAVSLAEALKTNNNEAGSLLRVMQQAEEDGNINKAARGGFAQDALNWYYTQKAGKTNEQFSADITAKQVAVAPSSGSVFNDPNDPGQLAYNQRLATMPTVQSIEQGLADLTARITKEGITDASGKVLLAPGVPYSPKTGLVITPESTRGGTMPVNVGVGIGGTSRADATAAGAAATS